MINSLEKDLRSRISKERNIEMEKYGRTKIYDKISTLLQGDKQIAFSLINHALAIIDDDIDTSLNNEQLDKAILILGKGFDEKEVVLKQGWEEDVFKLGKLLSKLQRNGFIYATELFQEVANYWNIEKRNLSRKGKVINSHDLDELNLEIGKSVGMQFLYLLCSELHKDSITSIASNYGFAIKLADNLSDLEEDLAEGFINISKENIDKHKIEITDLSKKNLQPYIKEELKRTKESYRKADEELEEISKQFPSSKEGLSIFKEIAHSWLKEVSDIYSLE